MTSWGPPSIPNTPVIGRNKQSETSISLSSTSGSETPIFSFVNDSQIVTSSSSCESSRRASRDMGTPSNYSLPPQRYQLKRHSVDGFNFSDKNFMNNTAASALSQQNKRSFLYNTDNNNQRKQDFSVDNSHNKFKCNNSNNKEVSPHSNNHKYDDSNSFVNEIESDNSDNCKSSDRNMVRDYSYNDNNKRAINNKPSDSIRTSKDLVGNDETDSSMNSKSQISPPRTPSPSQQLR